jgi:exonuclease VII small subunit
LVQRGRELSALCARLLGEAELALSQLAASPAGELVEQELDWNEENA